MTRQAKFEGQTTIVLQGARAPDTIYVALGLAWTVVVVLVVTSTLFDKARDDQDFVGFTLLTLPVLAWALAGPISRLRGCQPFLEADTTGLRLHPSLAPDLLPWSEIRSLSIQTEPGGRGFGGRIRVLLRDPVRSIAFPFGTSEIRLRLRDLDLSYKTAADLLRQLKRLRSEPSLSGENNMVS